MKLKFVGTSSGKASLNRFHSSLLLSSENYNLLVDAGDGISRALLINNIDFDSINGIVFTHLHPDHFSGLPALIVQMKMMNRIKPLDIFIHQSLKDVVQEFLERTYLLPEKMKFEIRFRIFEDNELVKISNDYSLIARKNSHLFQLEKYKVNHPSISLYSASLLFDIESKKIIYTADISSVEDLFLFREFISDIFICEATHLEASILIQTLCKIEREKLYLTHYSDEDFQHINEILATFPISVRNNVILASDGLFIEI
ncbi:MAG TPA: MBL fold metallo-hydrolase [Ignavibacteriaceae bacterium]